MLSPRSLLGRYTIRQHLGAGGMGDVYVAHDPTLDRLVAVKVLADELSADADRLARFVREARAASALNHPSIVTVHDFGEHDGTHYLVTELVDGRTLREWSAQERPALLEVLEVIAQVATALGAAHKAGIVHRDVKPENLMIRTDGYVKVLDFGIAKLLVEAASPADTAGHTDPNRATMPGTILGTTRYMSPEQAMGTAVDARSDVWSLGIVLYELIAGKPPFEAPTPMGTLAMILGREPEPLDRAAPGTPEAVCAVVARALHKQPAERFASAGELADALRQVQHELVVGPAHARSGEAMRLPAPPAAVSPPTNLPPATSPIVGRDRELDEVATLLRTEGTRLVTLTGPGGTGKTRLALEVARALLPEVRDGVFAVDLSQLSDASLVAAHVGHALGLREAGSTPMGELLARHFGEREVLLLLDSFEHLLEAAPLVSELLSAAPGLMVLATSRAPLHLRHEREYEVEPLEVPAFSSLPPLDELERTGAVALFVARACDAKPSFALTAENARAVVEICRRLDGLPLAIELAAARVKLFAPQALLGKLEHRLKLLTGGARDLPGRQRTMRGAVQWSYDLLEAGERELLCRLAVFAGGCNYEAAETVCGAAGLDVMDGLGSLVDKSLLRQREHEDGESRFRMLDLVREFALEELGANGWADEARGEHARYFLRLAEESAPGLRRPDQRASLERLTPENDNLRAALSYLLERSSEDGERLAVALGYYWYSRSHYKEGRDWVERALEAVGAASPARARLLQHSATFRLRLGDHDGAAPRARDSLMLARALGDRELAARALNTLAMLAFAASRLAESRVCFEEALAIARELDDRSLGGLFLGNLGDLARIESDYAKAARYYEESLEAEGPERFTTGAAVCLVNIGAVRFEEGDLEKASACYSEAVATARKLGNMDIVAMALDGLAAIAVERGRSELAARLAGAAEAELESLGIPLQPLEGAFRARYVEKLKGLLDAAAFEREWARGRSMGLEAAVAEALESD